MTMLMMTEDDMPSFLKRSGSGPVKFKPRRWKKMKATRPEGEKWQSATRWQVTVPTELSMTVNGKKTGLASGTRLVWVIEGRKWAELRDSEDFAKVDMRTWEAMKRAGREVK